MCMTSTPPPRREDSPGVSLDDLGMSIEDLRMCLGCGLVYGDDDIHSALHVWMDNRPQTHESRDPQVEDDKVIALAKLKGRATAARILAGERSNPDDEPSEDDPPVFDREATHDDPRVDAILDTPWPLIAGKPDQQPANRRPDYDDFRDESGQVDWLAFRAAVAAYDPGDEEAAPSGG